MRGTVYKKKRPREDITFTLASSGGVHRVHKRLEKVPGSSESRTPLLLVFFVREREEGRVCVNAFQSKDDVANRVRRNKFYTSWSNGTCAAAEIHVCMRSFCLDGMKIHLTPRVQVPTRYIIGVSLARQCRGKNGDPVRTVFSPLVVRTSPPHHAGISRYTTTS